MQNRAENEISARYFSIKTFLLDFFYFTPRAVNGLASVGNVSAYACILGLSVLQSVLYGLDLRCALHFEFREVVLEFLIRSDLYLIAEPVTFL